MIYEDEKDYIMRIIKEMARVLFSLMLGKPYQQVELPLENKFQVSGSDRKNFREMIDRGEINEAENLFLEELDYSSREETAAAVLLYEYISEKGEDFLKAHNYSSEEVMDGLRQLAERAGYGDIIVK